MSLSYPYTPFPFNVTAISPLFQLSPLSSNGTSMGWVPSCITPECMPTASWSTSAVNATLSFQYWGVGVAFDGKVQGNTTVQLVRDDVQHEWKPSGETLFNLLSKPTDQFFQHNVTLKVIDASPNALLTVTRARVNGSSYGDFYLYTDRWVLPSNEDRLKYTGFVPQSSVAHAESSTTYVSSSAGDSVSMQFNGSALLVYGPCGPTNGLMRISIDGQQEVVNTSKPFASNDCLLIQSWGLPEVLHELLIENVDGGKLGIDRLDFFRFQTQVIPGVRTPVSAVAVPIFIGSRQTANELA
ncbi:unnamed protein product [Rhizoctonia solani]|uniref:Uncharacterized protein n=1 Tax=Rhizoctonia solani TaxID=456999 RepID=A0A8H3BUR2_9AGAM|nr:unnamed protein product [Rhizoctonia solani]